MLSHRPMNRSTMKEGTYLSVCCPKEMVGYTQRAPVKLSCLVQPRFSSCSSFFVVSSRSGLFWRKTLHMGNLHENISSIKGLYFSKVAHLKCINI